MIKLQWFKEVLKSEKQKELENLKVEGQKLKNEILEAKLSKEKTPTVTPITTVKEEQVPTKPYKTIKFVNSILTVILQDGTVFSKTEANQEDFYTVKEATTDQEIINLMITKEAQEENKQIEILKEKAENTIKGFDSLKDYTDHFEFKENSVYLKVDGKTINRTIPPIVVEKFAEIIGGTGIGEEFEALKKFTLKCFTNPNAQSAEDLYKFLSKHQFKIDKHGNFYGYRRVVSVADDKNKDLVEFISNTYTKIKAVWKKKPVNYVVLNRPETGYVFSKIGSEVEGVLIGNLEELYLNLPTMQENRYTDAHTHSMDYRIGEVASIPRDKGDDDNSVSCSRGLHIASKAYNYNGFGDTPILAIINPIDVLAVPEGEDGKLRTCRWFFASVLNDEEKHILDDSDFDVEELGDVFEAKCLENMQEYIQNSFAEEVKRHTFTLNSLSSVDMGNIVTSLEDMKRSIDNRVKKVDE